MGFEQGKAKRRFRFNELCIIFLSVDIIIHVPVRGFFLKSCTISRNKAMCLKRELKTVPDDIPPTVTSIDLSSNKLTKIQAADFTLLPVLIQLDLNLNRISQIDSFALASLVSLQKLNLNNNHLVDLEWNVFDHLRNLTELRINRNRIKVVSSPSLLSLRSLLLLDISNNKLEKKTNLHLILQHLPHLKVLVLKGNGFKSFHSSELTNHSLDLHTLDISKNPLEDFRITANVFPDLTNLNIQDICGKTKMKWNVRDKTLLRGVSQLDISGLHMALDDMKALFESVNSSLTYLKMNGMKGNIRALINISCTIPTMSTLQVQMVNLTSISSDLFKWCINVTELDSSRNKIDTIQENAFTPLVHLRILKLSNNHFSSVPGHLPNLVKLDLSLNKIRAVDCRDFSHQTKLQELGLEHNKLTALPDCIFKDLVQLHVLKLHYNQLTSLNGAFIKPLPNLKQLHLHGNKLTAIGKQEFEGLGSLLNVSLHYNPIGTIDKHGFVGLTNLTQIQLQSNNIHKSALDTGAFNALINLRSLNLEVNHIKYDENKVLNQTPFSNLSNLEVLSISAQHYRQKSHLPKNFLKGLENLSWFSARNIQLIDLDQDFFRYTPNLERLDISSNDLGNLSPQHFSPISNLKRLYISRTSLQSLDFLKESNLSKLEFLQARKNQYSIITKEVILSLPSLVYVDFLNNSFMCDCDNAWFLNWTKTSKQTQVSGASNFLCNYPEGFKGKHLLEFDLTSCLVETGFICYVSTTCMILCFMVSSFTYHFMRWQLYCAYYLFLAWLYNKKHENKQTPHEYDAFISYNTHDEPWVTGELLPKLEGEQGWRLCLHHRDFEPDAIYGSSKTICVISHRYLESEWCSREVQTASFRLFDEKKDVLILVFLEDIPTYLLSPYHRMRKLLKKQTYLSWPRAAAYPEVFWEKLRQALQTGEHLNQGNLCLDVLDT